MTTDFINYYKVLQVDTEAETDVIESAYRRLAQKFHPDTNKAPDAEEKMKLLNEAKTVLTDPQERRKFDEQLAQSTQIPQGQSQSPAYEQETVEEDRWDDRAERARAAQFLQAIQQYINQNKWRSAREQLCVFQGLGTLPKDNWMLSTFSASLPEWQKAKRFNDLANQQARGFGLGLAFWSSLLYGSGVGFIGMLWLGISTLSSSNDVGLGFLMGIFGAFAGFAVGVFAALIGSWVYSARVAGQWGQLPDIFLGILAPLILAFLITFGIYILMGYLLLRGVITSFAMTSRNNRR
jgi:curved DNA-binding protein CbpA